MNKNFQKFQEILKVKNYILLDTNILIQSFEFLEEFAHIFDFLAEQKCTLLYSSLTRFEFIRGAFRKSFKTDRENYLKKLKLEQIIWKDEGDMQDTIFISHLYSALGLSDRNLPDLVDCSLGGFLKKYKTSMLLMTGNIKHFPTSVFDRIYVQAVDKHTNDIYPVSFYEYNDQKVDRIVKRIEAEDTKKD